MIRMSIEALWIRLRGWLRLLFQLGLIGLFLTGAYVIYASANQSYFVGVRLFGMTLNGVTIGDTVVSGAAVGVTVGVLACLVSAGLMFRGSSRQSARRFE